MEYTSKKTNARFGFLVTINGERTGARNDTFLSSFRFLSFSCAHSKRRNKDVYSSRGIQKIDTEAAGLLCETGEKILHRSNKDELEKGRSCARQNTREKLVSFFSKFPPHNVVMIVTRLLIFSICFQKYYFVRYIIIKRIIYKKVCINRIRWYDI